MTFRDELLALKMSTSTIWFHIPRIPLRTVQSWLAENIEGRREPPEWVQKFVLDHLKQKSKTL